MIKCPNKNLSEWKELESIVPNMAYVIWDKNNGYGIDKAPNGQPSILFESLLQQYGNREDAIIAKSKIYAEGYTPVMIDVNGEPMITKVELQNIELKDIDLAANEEIKSFSKVYDSIQKGTLSRLKSIMKYKNKNLSAIDELKNIIDKLSVVESQQGAMEFVQHVKDTISVTVQFLNGPISSINSRQLVQLKRDYLGFYIPMINQLQAIIDTTDLFKDPQFDAMRQQLLSINTTVGLINNKYDNLLKLKTRELLRNYAIASGSTYADEMINWLEDPKTDISWISQFIGMASNTDNEVIRIMENMIRNTKNQVDRNTFSAGKELLTYLRPAQEKYGTDVMKTLQERDNDGNTTGYFTRDINYGQFHKNRTALYDRLGEEFGLEKDQYGQWVTPSDKATLKKYNKKINKWLSKHTNRRYTEEYYDLREALKPETREALDEVQKAINTITSKVTENNIIYSHKLTDSELKQLELLQKEKQNLANTYYRNGNQKTGNDLLIAQDLKAYRTILSEKIKYKSDKVRYEKVRKQMKSELTDQAYNRWVALSNKWEYTQQFWDDLNSIEKSSSIQTTYYERLVEKRKEILKLHRKSDSLAINLETLSDGDRKAILQLDQDIADAYTMPPGKAQPTPGKKQFSDIAKVVELPQYKIDYNSALQAGPDAFKDWYAANHYEDKRGVMHPISVYTYLAPNDAKYMEYNPSNYWSQVDESSEWANSDFDNEGDYIQPKKQYYDNSKAMADIRNKPEVSTLYDKLIEKMSQSNAKIGFLAQTNNYKLPQMTARTLQMISAQDGIFNGLKYAVTDALAIRDDDKDYVEEFALRPDNTPIKHVPTRFIKMLDDPSMITTDVVGSVIEYFNMADNFNEMSKVSDDLEMILSRLSQLEVKGKKGKTPGSMNAFIKAQQLIDMNIYGKKKNRTEVTVGKKTIDLSKAFGTLYGYVTKVNLAYNMWAISTNYVTGQGYTDMEGILGRYYDTSDLAFAKSELFKELPAIVGNIGNVNDESKLMSMMQYNQVTRSNEETFNRLDNSAALRAINQHFWYNGYTAGDFTVKSQVLLSVYHSYRLATDSSGKQRFMTKQEFIKQNYSSDHKKGAVAFNQLNVTLYDAFSQENNKWVVDPKYKALVSTKLENNVKNKINALASKIDGNLSDTDRSAIHSNTYAQFLVMHRNFMIVGIQDRIKARQFNYNTGQVEEGLYRTVGRFISNEFSQGKLFVLKQIMADYDKLEDFEKYNIQKVLLELANVTILSLAVSMLLVPLADGDDGDKEWFIQAATYVAMRTAFEFRTLYNPLELTALLNSPSAAFASITNAAEMIKLLWLPNYFGEKTPFSASTSGVYKGMPKAFKSFIKMTPAKNILEATQPKPKRKYLENQLMF